MSEHNYGPWGGVYFLGIIGSAVYFIQQVEGVWAGTLGFLKALVWPAFLIYKIMEFFQV